MLALSNSSLSVTAPPSQLPSSLSNTISIDRSKESLNSVFVQASREVACVYQEGVIQIFPALRHGRLRAKASKGEA